MLNSDVQNFICTLDENANHSERAFNRAWSRLSDIIYELTSNFNEMDEDDEEILHKFIRLPVVINILLDLVAGKCNPPMSTDETRERAWKFYDHIPSKTCQEIKCEWNAYLNNINGFSLIDNIKSDIICMKHIRSSLESHGAGDIALAIVDGMIDGNEKTVEALDNSQPTR